MIAGHRRLAASITALALAAVLLRLLTLDLYPLTDTTEARYALVSRLMADSGDWITPWFRPGVPFWGKPPLAFWATAGLFKLFGFSEFAARLGTWLPAVATLGLTVWAGRRRFGAVPGAMAGLILSTNVLFFVTCGSVLTDTWLMLAATLAMLGFWDALEGRPGGVYVAGLGLGLGLLAKGPLMLVVAGPPLVFAMLQQRRLGALRPLPVFLGLVLTFVIALPWYLLAEQRTPGFLRYFIVGEHIQRYLDPSWAGDRYGTAHEEPYGTMLWFTFAGFLPWTLLVPWWRPAADATQRRWQLYLMGWAFWTPLFFCLARNILAPYLLPALPAMSLLLASGLGAWPATHRRLLYAGSATVPVALLMALALHLSGHLPLRSERDLVAEYRKLAAAGPLYFQGRAPFSAQLYGGADVVEVAPEGVADLPANSYLALKRGQPPPPGSLLLGRSHASRLYRLVPETAPEAPTAVPGPHQAER